MTLDILKSLWGKTMKILFVLMLFVSMVATAQDIQWSKGYTAGCDNAVEREDGSALLPEEIAFVMYYLDPTDGNPDAMHTITMGGGCTDTFVDTKVFPTGDYFRYAKTVDTSAQESVLSVGVPLTIQKARPNPPGGMR